MPLAATHEINEPDAARHPILGVLFCSLLSAVFWTCLLAATGAVLGQPVGARLLLGLGTAIAGFLCASLPLVLVAR